MFCRVLVCYLDLTIKMCAPATFSAAPLPFTLCTKAICQQWPDPGPGQQLAQEMEEEEGMEEDPSIDFEDGLWLNYRDPAEVPLQDIGLDADMVLKKVHLSQVFGQWDYPVVSLEKPPPKIYFERLELIYLCFKPVDVFCDLPPLYPSDFAFKSKICKELQALGVPGLEPWPMLLHGPSESGSSYFQRSFVGRGPPTWAC